MSESNLLLTTLAISSRALKPKATLLVMSALLVGCGGLESDGDSLASDSGSESVVDVDPRSGQGTSVTTPSSEESSAQEPEQSTDQGSEQNNEREPEQNTNQEPEQNTNQEPEQNNSQPNEPESTRDGDRDGVVDSRDQCPSTSSRQRNNVNAEGCGPAERDSDFDGVNDNRDLCENTPQSERANNRGCGEVSQAAFTESNGLLVVEMESTNYGDGWEFKTGAGSTGAGFLEWDGGDNFNRQGVGVITVPVVITNTGTYRFSWRSIVNRGDSSTESNDSWLRIDADNFFALKLTSGRGQSSPGNILCPDDQLRSNSCVGEEPEGSSGDGYFKVYRSGSPVRDWRWITGTSDRDRHEVFATFDSPGTYNVRISGRSDGHAIDRFVMHLSENDASANDISNRDAIRTSNPESARQ